MRSDFVQLREVVKTFGSGEGELTAVDSVDLDVREGELVTLLGPSGCGKTTTLRMIAGFEFPTHGEILVDGERINDVPPNRRPTSIVFQNYALFPHMTVAQNIAYGLRIAGKDRKEIARRTDEVIRLVGLQNLGDRSPAHLSGGQQQRVSLARSLIMEPKVLLLDEPLSNLDAKLRVATRLEIRRLQQRLGITSIYVTHDQEEAMVLSDRVVVMNEGRIQQIGTPREVYAHPANRFVAGFIGRVNIVTGHVAQAVSEDRLEVTLWGRTHTVSAVPGSYRVDDPVLVVVRPEAVVLDNEGSRPTEARIQEVVYLGNQISYRLSVGRDVVVCDVADPQVHAWYDVGQAVSVELHERSLHAMPMA